MSLARAHQARQAQLWGGTPLAKTLFDRVGAALLLLVTAPLFVVIALVVWLDDSGPVLARDRRIGQWGEQFVMLRFRSRTLDSSPELPLHSLRQTTRVGRLLRRASLDELPQLINVLKGDMSFVGPRPQKPDAVGQPGPDLRRLLLKPGLVGLRHARQRARLRPGEPVDPAWYLQNWSVGLDLVILWRSVRSVLRAPGVR